jgi:hypothetical protein
MADTPRKSDVEQQLRQTADAMSSRLSSLREEVSTTGTSVRDWMKDNPLKSVGGMLAAGLAVGLLFGGSKRRRRRHQKLIDQYIDALSDEVEAARDRGEEPAQALEKALRDRVPLVIYTSESDASASSKGALRNLLGESLEIVLRTALSFAARDVIDSVLGAVNVEEIMDDDLP